MSAAVGVDVAAFCAGVRGGDRRSLAKAITLLESRRADHAALGQAVLDALVAESGGAIRVGISGTPGVGKSSLVEALGNLVIERGCRVAVLAVDPSSPRSGGSILGDKTRMEELARRPESFIRPSPSGGSLGGVAHRTRETMLLCEAAGFDVVLVETVGIGQSESAVASMVDFFAVLIQPGAGDELQGMKRGVLELADALVVNKADGDQQQAARRAQGEYRQALELLAPRHGDWVPPVLLASAHSGEGIAAFWDTVLAHRAALVASQGLVARRREQDRAWMWSLVEEGLRDGFHANTRVQRETPIREAEVAAQRVTPAAAARSLLEAFRAAVD